MPFENFMAKIKNFFVKNQTKKRVHSKVIFQRRKSFFLLSNFPSYYLKPIINNGRNIFGKKISIFFEFDIVISRSYLLIPK